MKYEWDDRKREINERQHGVAFAQAEDFDWSLALIEPDRRRDYGEDRFIAVGPVEDRLHVMIFTMRGPSTVRIISFRKANRREIGHYDKTQDQNADEG